MQPFKRYHMEIDFRHAEIGRAVVPDGFRLRPWAPGLLESHAQVKYESFRLEPDSCLFPSLGVIGGCEKLMQAITSHSRFLPQATWLVEFSECKSGEGIPCGTIQGLSQSSTLGAIQNIGVSPAYRGQGLGRTLLVKALRGFRSVGLEKVSLEVTADNLVAIKLYRSLGFHYVGTSYRYALDSTAT